jgi:hypothetical protein
MGSPHSYDINNRNEKEERSIHMIKRSSITVATILTIGILFSGVAFGVEPPDGHMPSPGPCMASLPPHGPHEQPVPAGMKLILNYMEINVLAELTGLSQENIRMMLVCAPVPAILDQYGVDPKTFHASMDKQTVKLVRQAAAAGVIDKKQADEILKRMSQKPDYR